MKFTPVFTSGKMKMMFDIIDGIGDKMVIEIGKELKNSNIQEIRTWAQRFTNDNIGSVAFGIETNCEEIH